MSVQVGERGPHVLRVAAGAVVLWTVAFHGSAAPAADVSFNRDVRPILSDTCFACHGPDAEARQADLRLDLADGATAGEGPAVVPGKPEESPLFQRIISKDEAELMPPPDSNKTLTGEQKEILRRWIAEGAVYDGHWSFQPIQPSSVPESDRPNPVDAFLDARLAQEKLPVNAEADRQTLIRRVAFALTGLPPTLEEIDEYLGDGAPDAYERMVDRYLSSPRYGEEMARHWLDVARYADTHGLHLDNERQMWAYRDWVVRAFNENLPYDQFTVWQLAGDLLPEPTREQLVATGFNRCNVTTSEGGAIAEEFAYRYAVDRTSTTAQAWLGLTAGCAQCHDHKFDPLTTKEFYSLYAFFNSAADPAMDGNIDTTAPFLKLPTPEHTAAAEAAAAEEARLRTALEEASAKTDYTDPATGETAPRKPVRDVLFDEAFPVGSQSRSSSRNAVVWKFDPAFGAAAGRRVIEQTFAADYNDTVEFKLRPMAVPQDGMLTIRLRVEPLDVPQSVTIAPNGKGGLSWTRTAEGLARDDKVEVRPGEWATLALSAEALGLKPGERLTSLTFGQKGGVAYWDECVLSGDSDPASDPLESLSAWRKAIGTSAPPDFPAELHPILEGGPDRALSPEEADKLQRFYLAFVARPRSAELAEVRDAWESARSARITAEDAPGTFVYRDSEQPRESFLMLRGQYDSPGEKVEPAIPAFLPPIARGEEHRLTRLDLANWLIAPENPLTARVTVNRLWQQVFGMGLVETSDDFGAQGTPPSHPELLDWLATEFRESGWDVKRFMRRLVTSDAFRRNGRFTQETQSRDPANRLYARGPRFRLDAEQVRDNALFVSGLMNFEMGGRGVRPYQPPNIWEPVGYSDSNTRFYLQDHGGALYRRSVYVFLKRTAPPPFLSNFDAPNREQACIARERSNTPLQALQLMNDVQHFEAARALAERAIAEGGASEADKIAFLYRVVLARRPDGAETALVSSALDAQREIFASEPEAAKLAIAVGESQPRGIAPADETASWTMIANLILNFDETLNRN